MSVLDIKLTLTLDVELTLKFGHPMLQPTFNQASLTLSACWDCFCIGKKLFAAAKLGF